MILEEIRLEKSQTELLLHIMLYYSRKDLNDIFMYDDTASLRSSFSYQSVIKNSAFKIKEERKKIWM